MEEQAVVMRQLDDFLKRRGLRLNFLARAAGIDESSLYGFRSGHKLLTRRKLEKLKSFMLDYDRRLDAAAPKGGDR